MPAGFCRGTTCFLMVAQLLLVHTHAMVWRADLPVPAHGLVGHLCSVCPGSVSRSEEGHRHMVFCPSPSQCPMLLGACPRGQVQH